MVFQDYGNALLPWRTVARNTALGLEGRVGPDERRRRVAQALQMVGLADAGSEYPWRLSGGMAQRAQIARALALQPKVLLMDEPFGALDAITKAALQDALLHVQHQTDATVVFITHDLDEAIYLSDRVLVLAGRPGVDKASAWIPKYRVREINWRLANCRSISDRGTSLDRRCGPKMTSRARAQFVGLLLPIVVICLWQLSEWIGLLHYEYLPAPLEVMESTGGPGSNRRIDRRCRAHTVRDPCGARE